MEFEKLHNTRDLGGMRTGDGRVIRPGKLYRSGQLSDVSDGDMKSLSSHIHTIIDFRTEKERRDEPDREIPGVRNLHIPILDDLTAGITREKEADQDAIKRFLLKPEEAIHYMCKMYRRFASDQAVSRYRRFIEVLLEAEGPVLWHCTAGKDRAGIASVIVEEILGVKREDILDDYLKTNDYLSQDISFLIDFVLRQAGLDGTDNSVAREAMRILFGAQKDYLREYYDAVTSKYESMDGLIRDGLGVNESKKKRLREMYS